MRMMPLLVLLLSLSHAYAQWPVRLQAEDYTGQFNVSTKKIYCEEGGQQVGHMEVGDWMNFSVTTQAAGIYRISFRTSGQLAKLEIRNPSNQAVYASHEAAATASAYIYRTTSVDVKLASGTQTIRVHSLSKGWHLNWIEVDTTYLILMNKMESTADFDDWTGENCRVGSRTISTVIKRKGSGSARFELTKLDTANTSLGSPCVRSEMRRQSEVGAGKSNRWFAASIYLSGDQADDPLAMAIMQWHEWPDFELGENYRNPPISLAIQNGRYYMKVQWAAAAVNTNETKDGEDFYDLGPIDKEQWVDWVFHINFSWTGTGILEVYKDGVRLLNRRGPNCFNDQSWPYFKIGVYKWGLNGYSAYSPNTTVVIYYDEIRIGNENSSLSEMSAK